MFIIHQNLIDYKMVLDSTIYIILKNDELIFGRENMIYSTLRTEKHL